MQIVTLKYHLKLYQNIRSNNKEYENMLPLNSFCDTYKDKFQ